MRYIDDVFAIWQGNIESLTTVDEILKDSHPEIQFQVNTGGKSVPFMDMRIYYIDRNRIESDLYVKPTDRNQLLLYDNFHPPHVFRLIVRSPLLQVK